MFGNVPSLRGRYERCEEILDEQQYKSMWRAFDTELGMEIAWNRVFLSKLSPTVKMQFMTEVATTLTLTNDQPSWMRYGCKTLHHAATRCNTLQHADVDAHEGSAKLDAV